jgi:hypothetical protein
MRNVPMNVFNSLLDEKSCECKSLQDEKKILTEKINGIQYKINKLQGMLLKRTDYDPESILCPYCFIDKSVSVKLSEISSNNIPDQFICPKCKHSFKKS